MKLCKYNFRLLSAGKCCHRMLERQRNLVDLPWAQWGGSYWNTSCSSSKSQNFQYFFPINETASFKTLDSDSQKMASPLIFHSQETLLWSAASDWLTPIGQIPSDQISGETSCLAWKQLIKKYIVEDCLKAYAFFCTVKSGKGRRTCYFD